jgi:hypothetical protein
MRREAQSTKEWEGSCWPGSGVAYMFEGTHVRKWEVRSGRFDAIAIARGWAEQLMNVEC